MFSVLQIVAMVTEYVTQSMADTDLSVTTVKKLRMEQTGQKDTQVIIPKSNYVSLLPPIAYLFFIPQFLFLLFLPLFFYFISPFLPCLLLSSFLPFFFD